MPIQKNNNNNIETFIYVCFKVSVMLTALRVSSALSLTQPLQILHRPLVALQRRVGLGRLIQQHLQS